MGVKPDVCTPSLAVVDEAVVDAAGCAVTEGVMDATDEALVAVLAPADGPAMAEAVTPPVLGHSAATALPLKMRPMSVEGSAETPAHWLLTRLATCWTLTAQLVEQGLCCLKSLELHDGSGVR